MNISTNPGVYYINSGSLKKESIETIVKGFIGLCSTVLKNKNFKPEYNINVVMVKGNPVYSYVYINSKEAVNLAQGLNPNGTKRIKYEADKACKYYKLKPQALERSLKGDLAELYEDYFGDMWKENFNVKNMKPSKPFSWSEYQEKEDDINMDYKPKQKSIVLEPLMSKSYTHEQYNGISLLPAQPRDDVRNVLGCSGLGKNITAKDIRDVYSKYDTKGNYRLNLNSGERDYYPIVNNVSEGSFTIEFDPCSSDASYAIHMQRKTIIKAQEILFYSL
jgi:hypothetical protein